MIEWLAISQATGFIAARELIGYRSGTFLLRSLPNLTHLMLLLIWFVSSVATLGSQWHTANSTIRYAILIVMLLLFPIFNAIDIESRLVPTLLIKVGAIYCAIVVVIFYGISGLVRSVICIALYFLPMIIIAKLRPGSIGGGDIRLGLLIGLIVGAFGSPIMILSLLLMANVLAICVFVYCRIRHRSSRLSIPLVPYLTVSTMLVSLRLI